MDSKADLSIAVKARLLQTCSEIDHSNTQGTSRGKRDQGSCMIKQQLLSFALLIEPLTPFSNDFLP